MSDISSSLQRPLVPPESIGTCALTLSHEMNLLRCHTPVPKEVNRSLHMCAQDVQITCTANSKVNNSQCYDYNINRAYHLQNDPWV
jgi:hypothetical protein